jgi:hypothetical protein
MPTRQFHRLYKRHSRALLRDHSGKIVRSSRQTMYTEGFGDNALIGSGSFNTHIGTISRIVLSAHSATSGEQSWKRNSRATLGSRVGSFPIHAGLNIEGSLRTICIGLMPSGGIMPASSQDLIEGRPITEMASAAK